MRTLAILLSFALMLSSCATVFNGTKSKLTVVNCEPPGADVYLNGAYIGKAPVEFKVSKKGLHKKTDKITIRAEGYQDQDIFVSMRVKAGSVVLNCIFGVLGLALDFATGAIYKPLDPNIRYNLQKIK